MQIYNVKGKNPLCAQSFSDKALSRNLSYFFHNYKSHYPNLVPKLMQHPLKIIGGQPAGRVGPNRVGADLNSASLARDLPVYLDS